MTPIHLMRNMETFNFQRIDNVPLTQKEKVIQLLMRSLNVDLPYLLGEHTDTGELSCFPPTVFSSVLTYHKAMVC